MPSRQEDKFRLPSHPLAATPAALQRSRCSEATHTNGDRIGRQLWCRACLMCQENPSPARCRFQNLRLVGTSPECSPTRLSIERQIRNTKTILDKSGGASRLMSLTDPDPVRHAERLGVPQSLEGPAKKRIAIQNTSSQMNSELHATRRYYLSPELSRSRSSAKHLAFNRNLRRIAGILW